MTNRKKTRTCWTVDTLKQLGDGVIYGTIFGLLLDSGVGGSGVVRGGGRGGRSSSSGRGPLTRHGWGRGVRPGEKVLS